MRSDHDSSPPATPSASFVSDYAASMPAEYRARFHEAAILSHAGVVFRRGTNPTRVEPWATHDGTTAVCVVADDAPGLLSLVSASIVVHELDIVAAQAYCRDNASGGREAVDFFWLTRSQTAGRKTVDDAMITRVGEVLNSLVLGKTSVESARRRAEALRDQADASATHVWFADELKDGLSELFVETGDRLGILFAVATALFHARVKILRSEATISSGLARDRFLIAEFDGRPIGPVRRQEVQSQVLAAIQTWWKRGVA
jgi:[protein-PII] uridylyltransferase